MATIDDQATAREEMHREIAIQQRKPELPHIGVCHWCKDEILTGCFCDSNCQQDYEKYSRFNS